MDVEPPSSEVSNSKAPEASENLPTHMAIDSDGDAIMSDVIHRIHAMVNMSRKLFAARTKPIKKPGQKRIGAKKAKKLEVSASSSYQLGPADATTYRALSARCNYLAQDRPDIAFSSKELCREFSIPTQSSFKKL